MLGLETVRLVRYALTTSYYEPTYLCTRTLLISIESKSPNGNSNALLACLTCDSP